MVFVVLVNGLDNLNIASFVFIAVFKILLCCVVKLGLKLELLFISVYYNIPLN
jgi:hypothetical protein